MAVAGAVRHLISLRGWGGPELEEFFELVDQYVAGYLAQWADLIVARHHDIAVLARLASTDALPVVNAMTRVNRPCEVLSDLYVLSRDAALSNLRYLFVGVDATSLRHGRRLPGAFVGYRFKRLLMPVQQAMTARALLG